MSKITQIVSIYIILYTWGSVIQKQTGNKVISYFVSSLKSAMLHYLLFLNQIPHNFHAQSCRITRMIRQWDFFHFHHFNRVSHCAG